MDPTEQQRLDEINRAIDQELARAKAENRRPHTAGLYWVAGDIVLKSKGHGVHAVPR